MQLVFTGSRRGPSPRQRDTFLRTLSGLIKIAATKEAPGEPLLFRHGDCIGWDAAAHDVADELNFMIIIHPAIVPKHLRAFKAARMTNDRPPIIVLDPKPPLVRNQDMVDLSERMIGCPGEFEEQFRGSGTWHALRCGRRRGLDVLTIFPDGSIRLDCGNRYPSPWPTT